MNRFFTPHLRSGCFRSQGYRCAQRHFDASRQIFRFSSRCLRARWCRFCRRTIGDSPLMHRAAPGTKRGLLFLRQRSWGCNSWLYRRELDWRFRGLLDSRFLDNDRLFRNDRFLGNSLRLGRCSGRGRLWRMLVSCLRYWWGESSDLPSQFEKFAV
jgi:hypothetical protein